MSNLIAFHFEGHAVRVVEIGGEPWFVAKEVADVLGYSDAEAMTRKLDEDERQNLQIVGFGNRGVTAINEAGLYSCILTSQKPEAKPFKRWVTHDVLPTIRKTGSYSMPGKRPVETATEALKLTPLAVKAARAFGLDKNAAAISANQFVQKLTGVNLLENFGHTHLEAENQDALYLSPTELGKRMGISAQKVNLLLAGAGFQMKRGDVWEVLEAGKDFARIFDTGKRHGSGVPIQQIKWSATVLPLLKPVAEEA